MYLLRLFKRLLDVLGIPSEFDALLKFIGLPAGLAGMTLYFAWAKENPHWIIFLAAAVYAFTAASIWISLTLARSLRVFRGLHLEAIQPGHINVETDGSINLIVSAKIRNISERDIYFRIKDGSLSVAGRTNQEARVAEGVKFLPKNATAIVSTSSVTGIPPENNVKGSTRLTMLYGPAADELPYEAVFSANLTISLEIPAKKIASSEGSFVFKADFNPVEHRRVLAG